MSKKSEGIFVFFSATVPASGLLGGDITRAEKEAEIADSAKLSVGARVDDAHAINFFLTLSVRLCTHELFKKYFFEAQ